METETSIETTVVTSVSDLFEDEEMEVTTEITSPEELPADQLELLQSIITNQETIIQQNTDSIALLQEIDATCVNFLFVFGILCVCKFVHFIVFRVIFSGIN